MRSIPLGYHAEERRETLVHAGEISVSASTTRRRRSGLGREPPGLCANFLSKGLRMRSTTVRDETSLEKPGTRPPVERLWVRAWRWFTRGRVRRLRREQFLALSPSRVFTFSIDAANLERTTPRSFRFQLLSPLPLTLETDQTLEYQWRFLARTFKMKTRVVQLVAPGMIEEIQLKGPFRLWHHVRRLKSTAGGTWAIDELEYQLSWGVIGTLLDRLIVRRKLDQLFDYRQARLIELLLPDAAEAAQATDTRASLKRMRRPERSPEASE